MEAPLPERIPAAVVPFEAPVLLGTRVQQEDRERVALLCNFVPGTNSTYAISWADLPNVTPLAGFDAALHQGIGELENVTPKSVQKAARTLRASGAAGPAAQAEEAQLSQTERRRRSRISAALAQSLLRAIYPGSEALMKTRIPSTSLRRACQLNGLSSDTVIDDLEELAEILLQVGLYEQTYRDTVGPLRLTTDQLGELALHCRHRSEHSTHTGDQHCYKLSADTAVAAQQAARGLLTLIDKHVHNVATTLARWKSLKGPVKAAVSGLENVLDGWDTVLGFHGGIWELPGASLTSRAASLWALIGGISGYLTQRH